MAISYPREQKTETLEMLSILLSSDHHVYELNEAVRIEL